jgi:hypothetical protein
MEHSKKFYIDGDCRNDDRRDLSEWQNGRVLEMAMLEIQDALTTGYEKRKKKFDAWRISVDDCRAVLALYENLRLANPKVTLYHEVSAEKAIHNRNGKEDFVSVNASGSNYYAGQGIYWGVERPFLWVDHKSENSECYVLRDVPLDSMFFSMNGGKMMGVLPTQELTAHAVFDATETAIGNDYAENWNNTESMHVYPSTDSIIIDSSQKEELARTGTNMKTFELELLSDDFGNKEKQLWWKCTGDVFGHDITRSHLEEEYIRFIDESLGLIGYEEVPGGDDWYGPYQRFYVRETSPLLVGAVADMVGAIEIVFGKEGTPGKQLIDQFRQRNNKAI